MGNRQSITMKPRPGRRYPLPAFPVPPSFWYPEGTMTTAKPQYSKAMKTALKTLEEISHITITQEEIDSLTNEESDRLLAALMNAQDAIGSKFNSLRHM